MITPGRERVKKVSFFKLQFLVKTVCHYQIVFQLSCIFERAGSREKVTSTTYEFNFLMCEPS